jgi:hypothetical protein
MHLLQSISESLSHKCVGFTSGPKSGKYLENGHIEGKNCSINVASQNVYLYHDHWYNSSQRKFPLKKENRNGSKLLLTYSILAID